MNTQVLKRLDTNMLHGIADVIHLIVEARDGPQEDAGHEIEYAMQAVLLMVDAATKHQSATQRLDLFRTAVAMFADIAESDYIGPSTAPTTGSRSRIRSAEIYRYGALA